MIFSIREGLRESLIERGFPVVVDCGESRPKLRGDIRQRHRVVVYRDREGGDTREAAPGGSADILYVRMVGYKIEIYAFDPGAAAFPWEHDIEVDKLVDAVIVALNDWTVEQKAWRWEYVSGRMLTPQDLQGDSVEALPVSGYVMQVKVGRAVKRLEYDGDLTYGTAEITDVDFDTTVTLDGDDYEEI